MRTGRVRYVLKDFPLQMHAQAFRAAEAAHCAGEQGKFWEMHGALFADQAALAAGAFERLAERLGVNLARFRACLESGKYAARIRADMAEGSRVGVTGTPTFLLGWASPDGTTVRVARIIRGAKPPAEFRDALDHLLSSR